MDLTTVAELWVDGDDAERAALLTHLLTHRNAVTPQQLAWQLKAHYDAIESANPARAASIARALTTLAASAPDPQIDALAQWTAALVATDEGRLAAAVFDFDQAAARFQAQKQPFWAAATQAGKMRALAMLGRYEEAFTCGTAALQVVAAGDDPLAIGKLEQNLGILHAICYQYEAAETLFRTARERFVLVGDFKELSAVENNLATALTAQHKFREATAIYEQALQRAAAAEITTLALLECNLGCLALYQGQYDRALDYLERSRRHYAVLGMQHELAIADQELADAYLELNLAGEAATIYAQVTPVFAELGLRAEQARALAYHGRACLSLGQAEAARTLLAEAHQLYTALALPIGKAMVLLQQAHLDHSQGDDEAAATAAAQAETAFATANVWGWLLQSRWLRAELARAQGQLGIAQPLLEATLRAAQAQTVPQVMQRCYTSLGLLALGQGNVTKAEHAFQQAIALIEELRAPLPAEEFRMEFMSDKLIPYAELVRLCLADGSQPRIIEALGYVERARSRALVDMLASAGPLQIKPKDPYEAELVTRLQALREELNWFYSHLHRPEPGDGSRSAVEANTLQAAASERESAILTILRQLQQGNAGVLLPTQDFDLAQLQRDLGTETVLVEYFVLDDTLLAFVVTETTVTVVELPGGEEAVKTALQQFHFQLGAFRYGMARVDTYLPQLVTRARHHLATLYDLLLRPLAEHLGERRLLVAPYRTLHYVPFHALYDGTRYVIEAREVCAIPSATVLHHCLAAPRPALQRAVLLGAPDAYAPRVHDEVLAVAPLFPEAITLLNEAATQAQLQQHATTADVLHLACHGRFRPDNPLFSALQLADGWMMVRDAYALDLNCALVTLSACETGMSVQAPGDDLIGLARGFFLAGAPALLVSLWMVDDAATAQFMTYFYQQLLAGAGPAAALRHAQRQLLTQQPHPFFWSPFTLLGRWE